MTKEKTQEKAPVRRNYKDTLFRMIFREKEQLLSLYNAVNGTQYTNAEELEIVTLENAIYMNMKNDLAFILDVSLNLYEHQSTFSPNMPLRNLFYVSRELQKHVNSDELYRSALVKIPTPRFLVFYNGRKEQPEKRILKLSDSYESPEEEPQLELVVTMLNINSGKNAELMERCRPLKEYALYVEKVRTYSKQMELAEAVERAVTESIQEGILSEFLLRYRKEAIEMSIFEYNEEEALKYIREDEFRMGKEEGIEEGRAKGIEQGIEQGELSKTRTVIRNMLERGMSEEDICALAECNKELIDEVKNQ